MQTQFRWVPLRYIAKTLKQREYHTVKRMIHGYRNVLLTVVSLVLLLSQFLFSAATAIEEQTQFNHHGNNNYDHATDDEESWESFHRRYLADDKKKKDDFGRLDYSVLSVGVMTLGLILVVEVMRHRLDHAAEGRPYFTAVLENIYAELTTLGIVEFCVFLLQEYHTSMDKEKKDVFGAVHFALFYTAIFNAFQSVVLCFITTRISQKLWVQTEALELNHYVEVREEFQRVEELMRKKHQSKSKSKDSEAASSTGSDEDIANAVEKSGMQQDEESEDPYHSEYVFEVSWRGLRSLFARMMDLVRFPQLMKRYNELLVQVRFHELRVHFLQSNNLPAKLEVSDYLIRCEQRLLIKMAHVSAAAWLLLTASINVLYYLMGIMGTQTEDPEIVSITLTYIFFCSMGLFVVLALVVYNKMKQIFATIMHREDFWDASHQDEETRHKLAEEQRNLFWFGSPGLVISALQFMQFGYAIALASVIMFWKEIDDGSLGMVWYWITILGCYGLFVAVSAHVIPRYTMCTSMGELVDKKRLDTTVANYHLEEAKRHRLEESYIHAYHLAHDVPEITFESDMKSDIPKTQSSNTLSSLGSATEASTPIFADPGRRLRRKKSVSDGVAFMASMKEDVPYGNRTTDDLLLSRSRTPPQGRSRENSEGVASMASVDSFGTDQEKIAQLVKMDVKSIRQVVSADDLKFPNDTKKVKFARRREKTPSDGVSSMASSKKHALIVDQTPDDNGDGMSSGQISEVDDIPPAAFDQQQHSVSTNHKERTTLNERLKNYYASKSYRVFSHVFGTMVAFFLVGLRVEKFLHTEGILPDYFISFGLESAASFWLLSGWLVLFLFGDVLIFFSVDKKDTSLKIRCLRIASTIDFIITSVCLIVFWSAESRRCCDSEEERRWLAESEEKEEVYSPYSDPAPCSCPTFGSRTYSGLGRLEPYVSLICLRLFRFAIAKKIMKRLDAHKSSGSIDDPDMLNIDHFTQSTRPDPHGKDHDDHGDHGHGQTKGTAAELWEEAMSKHPEIAEKYGVFSGEMLQIMLGIPLAPDVHSKSSETPDATPQNKASYALDNKYSNLPVEAQEIIMAGMLGRTVKSVDNQTPVGTIPEEDFSEKGPKNVAFEIADESSVPMQISLSEQLSFDVPHANLVRAMRRCDRKVLPILDKWSVVDVVMTHFEIVYFDASEFVPNPQSEASRQAIVGTKGGKGLLLRDVALGRKVVGHVRLSEISSIAIERYMPTDDPTAEDDTPDTVLPGTEFWRGEVSEWLGPPVWNSIRQDTLALHTTAGNTLYLRFYSDYEEAENTRDQLTDENDDKGENQITRNKAFQWIQTIGRGCGPEQLKQSLPHFGDDSDDELRDYLIVHQEGEHKKTRNLLAAHGAHMKSTDAVSDLALLHGHSSRKIQSRSHHGVGSLRSLSLRQSSLHKNLFGSTVKRADSTTQVDVENQKSPSFKRSQSMEPPKIEKTPSIKRSQSMDPDDNEKSPSFKRAQSMDGIHDC